ncbi:Outer membrane TonB-dependent transporter, utilization system for glycans and polysaccharides (PUL), SusC family, partial [hydrothermal vent metagenome]
TQILLRGLRSISASNSPLIVIDGAVATSGAFNSLNSDEIASINVLKGANLGALYGSRASNGALIVETKKGKFGDSFTVGYNTAVTFDNVAYMPDFQTSNGIGWDGVYDPIENTNWGPRFDGQLRPVGPVFADGSQQMVAYAPIANNLRDFYETGTTARHTFYMSGGNETSKYFMSVGRQNTSGIVPDDSYERTSFRVNASHEIGKLKMDVSSYFVGDEQSVVGSTIGDQNRPLYWFVLNTPANIPLTDYKDWDNPESYAHADNYYNAYYQNPYWAIGTNRDNNNTKRLLANMSATYDILENISVVGRLGINNTWGTGKEWRDAQVYDPVLQPAHSAVSSFLIDTEFQSNESNGNMFVQGNFKLSNDFTIKPIVGATFISTKYRDSEIQANNLSIPGFYDISNGTGALQAKVDQREKFTYGFFADITLGFRDWVYLNLAGRQDYTSTLPSDNNAYFYPAVSLSAVLSDAIPAITDNGILSYAKITVSNATVFNDLRPYALNERFHQQDIVNGSQRFPFPFGAINGFEVSTSAVDANIKKEKLNTTEIGLNLGFLDDRILFDGAVFQTITSDLITFTTPSVASGAQSFLTNIGELESTGIELAVSGNVLKVGDFSWNLSANFSTYKTVVNEITKDIKEVAIENYGTYGTYAIVGEVFPQIKAQSYTRDPQGRVVVGADGNPVVGDVIALGKTTPDFTIGTTSRMSWKGISLSATVDYRTGHVYFAQGANSMEFTGRSKESVSTNRQDFVWPNSVFDNGDDTYTENTNVPITDGVMGFWQNRFNEIKENYVKDATTFKIREVSLGYNVPRSLLEKTKIVQKLTVGVIARNLWTRLPEENRFSDPEFRNTRDTDDGNGIGIGGYLQSPPTRSLGFSVNIEF